MTATAPFPIQTSGTPTLEILPVTDLRESEHNTRKHFDQVKLAELKASIERSGILTPLLVRPAAVGGYYEIAGGHRRFRAAQLAGLEEVPCLVREMDDATFLEVLTIDNLQREDVHPLEEAQGYKNLMTLGEGWDIARIADRVGKSESYVYDRMKLLQLTTEAQALFLDGRFTAGHAILLARLSKKDQERCLAIENRNSYGNAVAGGMWQHEGEAHDPVGIQDQLGLDQEDDFGGGGRLKPVSVRELQAWIDRHVRMDEGQVDRQLFPETAAALGEAFAEKAKIVHITRSHLVDPEAKDPTGKRTYGNRAWKRADGEHEVDEFGEREASTSCEYSVLGLVVAGRGRGESFQVCIDNKRCTTHWGAEIKERNRRAREREKEAAGSSTKGEPAKPSWQREERLRQERRARSEARWKKGGEAVLRAIAAHVKKLRVEPATPAGKFFLEEVVGNGVHGLRDYGKIATKLGVPIGTSVVDMLRHLLMVTLISEGTPGWSGDNEKDLQSAADALKIKVNVKQLLDAANPEPKAEKPAPAKKARKKG